MDVSGFNNLVVVLIYGSLVFLSLLNFFNPLKVNKKANLWFGFFLLLWSTFWLDEVLSFSAIFHIDLSSIIFIQFIQFLTPVAFYLSVLFFTNPDFKFKTSDLKYLIIPFVFLINLLLFRLGNFQNQDIFELVFISLILFQALFYTGFSYVSIRKHQKRIQQFSANTEGINLNWLEYIILILLTINIVYVIYNVFFNPLSLNFFINTAFLLVIYIVGYYSLKQKEIYPLEEKQREELIAISEETEAQESKKKLISDTDLSIFKVKLEELMVTQKPYLDNELNLIKLSELLSVSTHQLSYVINNGFSKNFFQYVNEYRIDYAKTLLIDERNNHFSILGIAYESGFSSKTSFNITFKKLTNLTPSEYKKRSSSL